MKIVAYRLKNYGVEVLLVSLDTQRPAAQEQLATLAKKANIACFPITKDKTPLEIAKQALEYAKEHKKEIIVFDSAGRMHIDEVLMKELRDISEIIKPSETLLVADSMLGNDAVNIAKEFHEKIGITGIILSRFDGDAKGGAAISMRTITVCISLSKTLTKCRVFQSNL